MGLSIYRVYQRFRLNFVKSNFYCEQSFLGQIEIEIGLRIITIQVKLVKIPDTHGIYIRFSL